MLETTKPDHVDANGNKYWADEDLNALVKRYRMRNIWCWRVTQPNNSQAYLIQEKNKIVYEHQQYEAISLQLAIMKKLRIRPQNKKALRVFE